MSRYVDWEFKLQECKVSLVSVQCVWIPCTNGANERSASNVKHSSRKRRWAEEEGSKMVETAWVTSFCSSISSRLLLVPSIINSWSVGWFTIPLWSAKNTPLTQSTCRLLSIGCWLKSVAAYWISKPFLALRWHLSSTRDSMDLAHRSSTDEESAPIGILRILTFSILALRVTHCMNSWLTEVMSEHCKLTFFRVLQLWIAFKREWYSLCAFIWSRGKNKTARENCSSYDNESRSTTRVEKSPKSWKQM